MQISGFTSGSWDSSADTSFTLTNKFSGQAVAEVANTPHSGLREAIRVLAEAQQTIKFNARDRAMALSRAAELIRAKREQLISLVQLDTGFALADATKEVDRSAETLLLCAEEAKRLTGHMIPIEASAGGAGRLSFTKQIPRGVVCALTPFNSPLNTVVHKIGPALAAGNSIILKPASLTPLSAHALIEILLEAGIPPQMLALVFGSGSQLGSWLAEEQAIDYYAFTGSTEVGQTLHRAVGMRPTQLEMGSLSSTIVCDDADLDAAAAAIVAGALRKSGQVCTSVQRVYVQKDVATELTERVASLMHQERAGDPADPATTLGPLISPAEAERVANWFTEAMAGGAQAVIGGSKDGNVVEPTLLTDVADSARIMTSELFGPGVIMCEFTELDHAFQQANSTPFGLAAGIFTSNISRSFQAIDDLNVGALYVNQTSSSRIDAMPFSGHKLSGFGGPEGPAYAIREMSKEKTITISR
ncbi:aldehyde dehydrogenase family protein [Glutamicibacter uratoxydans]|uniref:aldehyde dehydrogenase family protein n=1 Tax=Glutamicibacter uratoxydans TaxID=43667 RepID=UPI003D6DCAC3